MAHFLLGFWLTPAQAVKWMGPGPEPGVLDQEAEEHSESGRVLSNLVWGFAPDPAPGAAG